MSWLCHTAPKRRSRRARVSSKHDRKEIERHSTLVVAVKKFTSSRGDELSVQRGQVVEVVCTRGNWVYVRDMDSNVGYIPKSCTVDVKKMGNFGNANNMGGGSSSGTMMDDENNNNITGPAPQSQAIDVSTLQRSGSSVNSVEVRHISNVPFTETHQHTGLERATTSADGNSQVIYEVPSHAASRRDEELAPALPPRSSNLPSPAEIKDQQDMVQPPNMHTPLQRYRPGHLKLSSSNQVIHSNHARFSYASPAPTPGSNHTPSRYSRTPSSPFSQLIAPTPTMDSTSSSSTLAAHTPSTCNCPPGHPPCTCNYCCIHSPRNPHARTHGAIGHQGSISSVSPSGQRHAVRRESSLNTPGSAHTPCSAGLPVSTASPVLEHFAPTPGPLSDNIQRGGHGFAFPSPSGFPYGRRARLQKMSRFPRDHQVHSTISENAPDNAGSTTPQRRGRTPPDRPRQLLTRMSQPCLVPDAVADHCRSNLLQQHRPFHLTFKRSLSLHDPSGKNVFTGHSHSSLPCTPQFQDKQSQSHHVLLQQSYQNAVTPETEGVSGAAVMSTAGSGKHSEVTHSFSSSPCRLFPSTSPATSLRSKGGFGGKNSCQSVDASDDRDTSSCTPPDDVFLPETNKPVGIYRCIRNHKPKFKGEIRLQENEIVIVLDYGKGEWTWVVTSSNVEGLVPKSILVQYKPRRNGIRTDSLASGNGKFSIDVATQTDKYFLPPIGCTSSSASAGLSTGDSSCYATNESSPLSTSLRAERTETRRMGDYRDQNMILLEAAATAVVEQSLKPKLCPPQEWFNTIDSLNDQERLRISSMNSDVDDGTITTATTVPPVGRTSLSLDRKTTASQVDSASGVGEEVHSKRTVAQNVDSEAASTQVNSEAASTQVNSEAASTQVNSEAASTQVNSEAASTRESVSTQVHSEAASTCESVSAKVDSEAASTHEAASTKVKSEAASTRVRANTSRTRPTTSKHHNGAPTKKGKGSTSTTDEAEETATEVVQPGSAHYHDRISGLGSVSFDKERTSSSSSSPGLGRRSQGPSSILTVIKDYAPPRAAKNCLSVKEGDVLQLQTHMHYPKGWMWVWHSTKRSFGYVPKSYVAYTYGTREKSRTNTLEHAV